MKPTKQRPLRTFARLRFVKVRDDVRLTGIRGWTGTVARVCSDGSAWIDLHSPAGLPAELQSFDDPARRNWVKLLPGDCCKHEAHS
jgi:hypothetical protein